VPRRPVVLATILIAILDHRSWRLRCPVAFVVLATGLRRIATVVRP
jgi:hypothetical protein